MPTTKSNKGTVQSSFNLFSFVKKTWVWGAVLFNSWALAKPKESVSISTLSFNNQTQCLASLSETPVTTMELCLAPAAETITFAPSLKLYGNCIVSGKEPHLEMLWSDECLTPVGDALDLASMFMEMVDSGVNVLEQQGDKNLFTALSKHVRKSKTMGEYYNSPEAFAVMTNHLIAQLIHTSHQLRSNSDQWGVALSQLSFSNLSSGMQEKLITNMLQEKDFEPLGEKMNNPKWTYTETKANFDNAFAVIRKMIMQKRMLSSEVVGSLMNIIIGADTAYKKRSGWSIKFGLFAPISVINNAMSALFNYLSNESLFNPNRDRLFVLFQAIFVRIYIISVHAYTDGNGRLALLLSNFILMAADMPPLPDKFSQVQLSDLARYTSFRPVILPEIKEVLNKQEGIEEVMSVDPDVSLWQRQVKWLRRVATANVSPYMSLQVAEIPTNVPDAKDIDKYNRLLNEGEHIQLNYLKRYVEDALQYYTRNIITSEEAPTLS